MKILLDPGHGINTPGKRSPDGRFLEYRFNREVSRLIISDLLDRGFDCETIVPEETDISLQERCARVNRHCRQLGINNVILVSIHANASGNGKEWTSPSGWSVYTSVGNTRADLLATHLADAARKHLPNMIIRSDYSDGDIDFEESFYILRHTLCPAVLIENGFFTNVQEVQFLLLRSGTRAIADLHVEGIVEYLTTL